MDAGFTSVMFDGSHMSVEENIAVTNKVIAMAHPKGVSVEAEIGSVRGSRRSATPSEGIFSPSKSTDDSTFRCPFVSENVVR